MTIDKQTIKLGIGGFILALLGLGIGYQTGSSRCKPRRRIYI